VDDCSICLVERLHLKDDVDHMPMWKRRINRLTPISSMMAVISYWIYFGFRIRYTLDAQRAAHRIFVYAWIFVAVEMGVACKFKISVNNSRLLLIIHVISSFLYDSSLAVHLA
jgi:hypothetical protein